MSIHNCQFCGKGTDIFKLTYPCDFEDYPDETGYVCSKCWAMIAQIVEKIMTPTITRMSRHIDWHYWPGTKIPEDISNG